MKKNVTLPQKLNQLRLNFKKKDGSVGLSLREAAKLITENGYAIQHAGYAKWEKMGANLPKRSAIEAICRSFQIGAEELEAREQQGIYIEFFAGIQPKKEQRVCEHEFAYGSYAITYSKR